MDYLHPLDHSGVDRLNDIPSHISALRAQRLRRLGELVAVAVAVIALALVVAMAIAPATSSAIAPALV
jgi:hypothetical protein